MFKECIQSTPFTTAYANQRYDASIPWKPESVFKSDNTLIATIRALAPKIPSDEALYAGVKEAFAYPYMDGGSSTATVVKNITGTRVINNMTFRIISLLDDSADSEKAMKFLEENFTKTFTSFMRLEKVTLFFAKSFPVLCFISPNQKSTVLFVPKLTYSKLHFIERGIPAYLPWYFEDGLDEQRMKLIESLKEKTPDAYLTILNELASQKDFRADMIDKYLNGFETIFERNLLRNVEDSLRSYISQIDNLKRQIGSLLTSKREAEIQAQSLALKINGEHENELADYFKANKKLALVSVNGMNIEFIAKDTLRYWDEDKAKTLIENRNSYIYKPDGLNGNSRIPDDDMELLLRAVFLDEKIRIRVMSAFQFTNQNYVRAITGYYYPIEMNDATPNPHHDAFGCLGDNENEINDALCAHDYVTAVEQCVAACKALNFLDPFVMQEFMKRLYGFARRGPDVNVRCFELPDGSVVKPEEAIRYLKEEKANG